VVLLFIGSSLSFSAADALAVLFGLFETDKEADINLKFFLQRGEFQRDMSGSWGNWMAGSR
jgi:hypothetical protein